MKTAIEILAEKLPGMHPEEQLMEELPHGSGIDGEWSCEIHKNGNVALFNSYHVMNNCGMYDGWGDFKIVLFVHKKTILHPLSSKQPAGKYQIIQQRGVLDWRMHTSFPRRNSFQGLRDYLESLFVDFFYCKDYHTKKPGICERDFPTITSEKAVEMLKKQHVTLE